MNIDKFLKSIPPIANKIKQFFESMDPLPTVITALGALLMLLGVVLYGQILLAIGGVLVGFAIGHHVFKDMSREQMDAFLKKVPAKVSEFSDKFLKSIPPIANKVKEILSNMNPIERSFAFLGILFTLIGVVVFDPVFFWIGIALLGYVGSFIMMGRLPGLKTYVVSLDIPTKLKDAKTKVGSLKFPKIFTTSGDILPFGSFFLPMVIVSIFAVSLLFAFVSPNADTASKIMQQVEQCVKGKDSDLLEDKYILKAICGTKYQEELPNGSLTGGADFSLAGDNVVFSGHVNTTSVHIVTEFTILVEYDGQTGTKTFHSVWIEPNNKHKFRFNPSEIDNKPSKEDVNTNDFVWKIREIKGVPIIE